MCVCVCCIVCVCVWLCCVVLCAYPQQQHHHHHQQQQQQQQKFSVHNQLLTVRDRYNGEYTLWCVCVCVCVSVHAVLQYVRRRCLRGNLCQPILPAVLHRLRFIGGQLNAVKSVIPTSMYLFKNNASGSFDIVLSATIELA